MGLLTRFLNDYFDERAKEIDENGSDDTDIYDDRNEVIDPRSPVWDGSEIHITPYGPDPTLPDPNEVNQD
ncbi:MAG: hypothetical protein ONB44_00010 [candidate division KSB1 bacterium]|nr:hypothetical protein [candidate division KSB1 bacterium]MDZ7300505.1 hypothetical protein [candidate division KSB1 bacterium]MDZ7309644.1 hypothetical protein [candidate division KSB1 bacterium]